MTGISEDSLSNYMTGKSIPGTKNLQKIAAALEVPLSYFADVDLPADADTDISMVPVIGVVPAGIPIEAIESFEGEIAVPRASLQGKGKVFALKVMGSSMEPTLSDGDVVLVAPNLQPQNGQVVVARFDLKDAVIRRYRDMNGVIVLQPDNSKYQPDVCSLDKDCHILGTVFMMQRKM